MDELINKLIEIDKNARARVARAEKSMTDAVEELEKTKEKLREENEKRFLEELEKEKAKQSRLLEQAQKQIEQAHKQTVEQLNSLYEEKCDEWVSAVVANTVT